MGCCYGAAQSRTRLKQLSNSSSSSRGSYLQSWLNLSISFLFILTCHALELLPRSGVETLLEIDFCPCVYPGFLPACFSLHPPSHIFFMILFFQPCPLVTGTLIFPINTEAPVGVNTHWVDLTRTPAGGGLGGPGGALTVTVPFAGVTPSCSPHPGFLSPHPPAACE